MSTENFAAGVAIGIAADGGPSQQEQADAKAWLKRIDEARKFDRFARKRYAIDRAYARGDRGQFEVNVPVAPSYIDVLTALLYARDPDLDVQPAGSTTPPPMAEVLEMARTQMQSDPQAQAEIAQAGQAAAQKAQGAALQAAGAAILPMITGQGAPQMPSGPMPDANAAAAVGSQAKADELAKAKAKELMAPYRQRLSDAKQFAQTLSVVIPYLWRTGKLKKAASPLVRSGLTVALGWIKATWQERTATDPVMQSQLNDLQDNLRRIQATEAEIAEGEAQNSDELKASLERQIAGLQGKVERIVARGMVFDYVRPEDITVSTAVPTLAQYVDAPWIAHRTFMSYEDAQSAFQELGDRIGKACRYYPVEPKDGDASARDIGSVQSLSAEDADSFRSGSSIRGDSNGSGSVRIEEVWDRNSDTIVTLIEGVDGYARKPYAPQPPTTRFYPFFQFAPLQVDGERHPESLIKRSETQLDDMNRLSSNRSEHRRRTLPKTAFNSMNLSPEEARKIEAGGTQELIPIALTDPAARVADQVVPIAYAGIDEALYDDGQTRAQLEMTWGIQEALSSTIQTAKTATEAEIQQHGTEARTDYKRDALDDMLNELAEFTAEIAMSKMSFDDVKRIAGPWAFWPEAVSAEDLATLCNVQIKAGSSGKPNTAARQQAWAQLAPQLQAAITTIGQLRGSSPESIADSLEQLVAETLQVAGDKLDPDRFLPSAPETAPAPPPQPAPQQAPAMGAA